MSTAIRQKKLSYIDRHGNRVAVDQPVGEYLTLGQLAAKWNVTERWVRRQVDEKKLSYTKLGGQLRFHVSDVEAYEAASRFAAAS